MRGKRLKHPMLESGTGLIPAHAGKTTPRQVRRPWRTAHPRACGENASPELRKAGGAGSSPRMRGKPARRSRSSTSAGLIPAHAGKTSVVSFLSDGNRAHPRACGENEILTAEDLNAQGSSPRMRGKPSTTYQRMCATGLIPAHAGKTKKARAL